MFIVKIGLSISAVVTIIEVESTLSCAGRVDFPCHYHSSIAVTPMVRLSGPIPGTGQFPHLRLGAPFAQQPKTEHPVCTLEEHRKPPIAILHHVVSETGKDDASKTGHARGLAPTKKCVIEYAVPGIHLVAVYLSKCAPRQHSRSIARLPIASIRTNSFKTGRTA